MPPARPLRLAPEWDPRYTRMLAVSAAGHALAVAAVLLLAPYARHRPLPLVAYTVEITDPSALGGRVPPGPVTGNLGGGATQPLPEPKGQPDAGKPREAAPAPEPPPKPAETKPVEPPPEPVAKAEPPPVVVPEKPAPEPKPEPKPEVKPAPKPEPKPEAKAAPKPESKPEAKPQAKPAEPPKAAHEPTPPPAKAEAKAGKPSAAAKSGNPAGQESAPPHDAYAAAAERWRSRAAAGGLGGTDGGSGPIGAGGDGKGGGGQLVALEFIAYRQQVINTIKGQWTNVIARPGLVAKVRFQIAADGSIDDVRLEQSSGNPAYDNSALRAVQHATLPAPPARYASEFRDFVMEFHSEETGGRGAG